MAPQWLHVLAIVSLILSGVCCLVILGDILAGHPQKMAVMNVVWPITALYLGPVAVWAYYGIGRQKAKPALAQGESPPGEDAPEGGTRAQDPREQQPDAGGRHPRSSTAAVARPRATAAPASERREHQARDRARAEAIHSPSWQSTFTGVTHCGAGCTLGDFVGDWIAYGAAWTIAGTALWPRMMAEFVCAYLLGIVFQYFSIVPMRHLRHAEGIWAAIKADTLSITAFEVGMFIWMALSRFVFFHHDLPPTEPAYWLMMQIAMIVGFATGFPMNWWLIKKGWKEAM